MGAAVGVAVGRAVGAAVGVAVGLVVGLAVGLAVGAACANATAKTREMRKICCMLVFFFFLLFRTHFLLTVKCIVFFVLFSVFKIDDGSFHDGAVERRQRED